MDVAMITYQYKDDGVVMELRRIHSAYPNALDIEFCAIGRSSPWPQYLTSPIWINLRAIAQDNRDKRLKMIEVA